MEECYICNRTSSQRWYPSNQSFGLVRCNSCQIRKNNKACPFCGIEGSDSPSDAVFNCAICLRETHQVCSNLFRGTISQQVCVVCEIRYRILYRDYNLKILKLRLQDIPSLLNYHIFFFSRYFQGNGLIPSHYIEEKAKVKKTLGKSNIVQKAQLKVIDASKALDERGEISSGASAVGSLSSTFAAPSSNDASFTTKDRSAASKQVRPSKGPASAGLESTRWDEIFRQQPCSHEAVCKRTRTVSVPIDSSQDTESLPEAVLSNLRELAVCYFRRPFLRGNGGTYRRLDPIEAILAFSDDFGLLPAMALSKRETRDIAFRMLCADADGGGSSLLQSIQRARDINAANGPAPESVLVAFLRAVACHGRRPLVDFADLGGPERPREAVAISALCYELGLSDSRRTQAICAKYPTEEDLAAQREAARLVVERRRAVDETAHGARVPYPLGDTNESSLLISNWRVSLLDAYNLFAQSPPPPSAASSAPPLAPEAARDLRQGFELLDADGDGFIGWDEAVAYFDSVALAELFVITCAGPASGNGVEQGVTWGEFTGGEPDGDEDAPGAVWLRLLAANEGAAARLREAALLLQLGPERYTTRRARFDDIGAGSPDLIGQLPSGLGFLCDIGRGMELVVYEVACPGPADGRLFYGDVLLAVDGEPLEGLTPATALARLATPRRTGQCEVEVRRDGTICKVELQPPLLSVSTASPPGRVCTPRRPDGLLPLSGLFRLATAFGLTPTVLSPGELMLRCDDLRPGHSLARDGPMEFGWDEVVGPLLGGIAEHDTCHERMATALAASAQAVVARLVPGERRLGTLFMYLGVPRYDGPDGANWARRRHLRGLVALQRRGSGNRNASGITGVHDVRAWSAPDSLLGNDGLGEYLEACRALGVVPLRAFCEQTLALAPVLRLRGSAVPTRQAIALAAGLEANRHAQELHLDSTGLTPAGAVAICMAAARCRRLRVLNLSHNFLGGHLDEDGSSCADVAAALARMVVEAGGLQELLLSGVGFRAAECRRLCDALVSGGSLQRLDISSNFVGESGARDIARLIRANENIIYVNLSWSNLDRSAIGLIQQAVRARNRPIQPPGGGRGRASLRHRSLSPTAAMGPGTGVEARGSRNGSREASPRKGLAHQSSEAHEPGNSSGDVSYEYRDLLDQPIEEAASILERVLERRELGGLAGVVDEHEARTVAVGMRVPKCVVLLDAPAREGQEPGKRANRISSPQTAAAVTNGTEFGRMLTDAEYLHLKTQADKLGRTPEERLAVVRYATDGRRLGAVQVWEQLEAFAGTSVRFAATSLLLTKLRGRDEAEAVHALQALVAARSRRASNVSAEEDTGGPLRKQLQISAPKHPVSGGTSDGRAAHGLAQSVAGILPAGGGGLGDNKARLLLPPVNGASAAPANGLGGGTNTAARGARRLGLSAGSEITDTKRSAPLARRVLFKDFF